MDDRISGGVAVITGAAGGIGLSIARAAASAGMKLVLADIAADRLADAARSLEEAGHEVLAVPTDVTDPSALDRLAEKAVGHFGNIRLLVNNAGIEMIGRAWEFSAEQWDRAMRINVLGPVNGVRAFVPAMIASGEPAFVANVASIGGLLTGPNQSAYLMSKHAILAFSECLHIDMESAAPHIRVSCVLPGPVQTRIFSNAPIGGDPAANARYAAQMDDMLESRGMSSDEAGKMIFDQIIEGRFWVTTHEEMLEAAAKSRAAHLAGLTRPAIRSAAENRLL